MMREIERLGALKRGNDSRPYQYSRFWCPSCEQEVERKTRDGMKAQNCSHKCYSKNRKPRGGYKPFVVINGYQYLRMPSHPNCTQSGYVAAHRHVAEMMLGRYLLPDEDVHHIDEDKTNNRPDNLIVLSHATHMRLHRLGMDRFISAGWEFLRLHENPDLLNG